MSKRGKGRLQPSNQITRQRQTTPSTNRSVRGASDGRHTVVEYQEGPIPSPEQMAKYEALLPGAVDRIIRMAEHQAEHRQHLEALAVPAAIKAEERGQRNGLLISFAGLAVALVLGLAGKELAAGLVGAGGLSSLAAVFVYGRRSQERERAAAR